MAIVFAAVAAFVLSAAWLVPAVRDALPGVAAYRDVILALLSLFIVFAALRQARTSPAEPLPASEPPPPVKPAPAEPAMASDGLVLLALLQEKGRFVDFLTEDITAYPDAQVAAASRVVHQGCSAVMKEYFAVEPVHGGKEGDKVTLDRSSDPGKYRLIGKLPPEPPFNGVVLHRGWKTAKISLPRVTRTTDAGGANIIAPAEVEVR